MSGQPTGTTTQTQQAPPASSQQNASRSNSSSYKGGTTSRYNSQQKNEGNSGSRNRNNRNRNRHSRGGKGKPTGNTFKKPTKPQRKPVVKLGPAYEYISDCCKVKALKPRCGMKVQVKDPETGKMKEERKGLGHWRCSQCRKYCSVTPQKPQPKETPNVADNTTAEASVPVSA